MAYSACYTSSLIPGSGGGGGGAPNIRAVLQAGNDALGLSLGGLSALAADDVNVTGAVNCGLLDAVGLVSCDGLTSTGLITCDGIDSSGAVECPSIIATGNIQCDTLTIASLDLTTVTCDNLTVTGRVYPLVNTTPIVPTLGSTRVVVIPQSLVGLPAGTPYSVGITWAQGFYTGKVEADFVVLNAGSARALVEVFYGSLAGLKIGYSSTLIAGGGDVYTVSVPFFVNILPATAEIHIRFTCFYSQGGTWNTTAESDLDLFRIF
jgi:hypothetical protein